MSEFHLIDVVFNDEDVLVQSLKEMGYTPITSVHAKPLHGYQGDKREQKAHIIIPRSQVGSASNDVGFERVGNGFKLHASEFDHQWRSGQKLKTLNKKYAEHKIGKEILKSGKYRITSRKENKNGQVEINLVVR